MPRRSRKGSGAYESDLIKVDRYYLSSKRCSCCGAVKKELGLNERVYICSCGNRIDRDVNAAINIREEGRRMLSALSERPMMPESSAWVMLLSLIKS